MKYLPPEHELEERFIRAGGPGGQHVNRTESGVQLRFDPSASEFLPETVASRLLKLAGTRASTAGVITIEATEYKSQRRNREQARARLAELIEKAYRRPRKRVKTRPTRAAKKKRLRAKRHRADIKQKRGKPSPED
ncbi:MAG: aminoacyl-tRNA hydrolase [Wenzhouxiangellaceae bacterium]|nr:aminoacyl-tRNA hydrolase [Wenzhouxiangellaceae bacterium]MBS3746365.1 aminoacyl-tRNA hydrolase [Wenzhouxiangellaceae bacterium]MBS3823712.1 aminoacyl-tRNA hydrolase [Wenzhouxiangellaceae bacterium]